MTKQLTEISLNRSSRILKQNKSKRAESKVKRGEVLELGLKPRGRWKESERDRKILSYFVILYKVRCLHLHYRWAVILQRLTRGWKQEHEACKAVLTYSFPLQIFLPWASWNVAVQPGREDLCQLTCAVLGTISDQWMIVMMEMMTTMMVSTESRNDLRSFQNIT